MSKGRDSLCVEIEACIINLSNTNQSWPKIFEVDYRLRLGNSNDYEPKILAIGPIHAGKDGLKKMEQHKVRYLQQLLQRRDDMSIDKLVEKVREMTEDSLQYYSTSLKLDAKKFMRTLLLDGCFVIELLRKYFANVNDPILDFGTLSQIRHDLMLFENQLPFFVLNKLFDMTKTENADDNLCHLVVFLVGDMFPWLDVLKFDSASDNLHPDHLLGLIYRCLVPFLTKTSSKAEGQERKNPIVVLLYSASELKEFGIRLKWSEENSSVSFEAGVLKLPHLQVSVETESLLKNLMTLRTDLLE